MADGKAKYNVEKTECITGEPLSNLVKISKITRKQRHLCLIKFTGDGCSARSVDEADREEAQQLEIRECPVTWSSRQLAGENT